MGCNESSENSILILKRSKSAYETMNIAQEQEDFLKKLKKYLSGIFDPIFFSHAIQLFQPVIKTNTLIMLEEEKQILDTGCSNIIENKEVFNTILDNVKQCYAHFCSSHKSKEKCEAPKLKETLKINSMKIFFENFFNVNDIIANIIQISNVIEKKKFIYNLLYIELGLLRLYRVVLIRV